MNNHLEVTASIRKKQPTNFAQKARISNSMRKDAYVKALEYQKRIDPLIQTNFSTSKLTVFIPKAEEEYDEQFSNSFSPNSSKNKLSPMPKISNRKPKQIKQKEKIQAETYNYNANINYDQNENENIQSVSQDRPKAKYSLFKRIDE